MSEELKKDIEEFLRQLAEVKIERVTKHTGLFARAKASELVERIERESLRRS